ncbi:hypothetical protein [Herbaspirillum sp. CAH-3]|uniref:hypothetical protein n=1 Tax=Herbaspirillum sp. CAH-3 TaxID=2605746 RepID=UPI0012AD0252|nr:hypothetical protein [Herbaspirillum sp. CAH-3]MRT30785.1 hypothetical protein [Herbaspirillum sp. CAH-3]
MKDPRAGKYGKVFQFEFKIAAKVLEPFNGRLEWSSADYEAFTFIRNDVRLVFYPYKSSAQNYALRVRDASSKNKKLASELMARLRIGNGFTTDFTQRNVNSDDLEQRLVDCEKLQRGWARKAVECA